MRRSGFTRSLRACQAFFRKLKFQYLEQKAKDQYIKIIVSDDAPSITAADNKELQSSNEGKKRELKEKKLRLAEVQNNIRTLAPLVEQGMSGFRFEPYVDSHDFLPQIT